MRAKRRRDAKVLSYQTIGQGRISFQNGPVGADGRVLMWVRVLVCFLTVIIYSSVGEENMFIYLYRLAVLLAKLTKTD